MKRNNPIPQDFDYDSEEFYNAIEQLARNGASNKEIAVGLKNTIQLNITPSTFDLILKGKVTQWTDEENQRRSLKINELIAHARLNVNRIIKAVYLSTALGKSTNKSVTTVRRRLRVNGELTDNEEIQTTEVVSGIAPNLSALGVWLYHHDKEWRKMQKGQEEDEASDAVPQGEKVKRGIDVSDWIDKELMEDEIIGRKGMTETGVEGIEDIGQVDENI